MAEYCMRTLGRFTNSTLRSPHLHARLIKKMVERQSNDEKDDF